MRKISYGSRSEKGIETLEVLMSVYSTCRLRNVNFFDFVKDTLDVDQIPVVITVAA